MTKYWNEYTINVCTFQSTTGRYIHINLQQKFRLRPFLNFRIDVSLLSDLIFAILVFSLSIVVFKWNGYETR